ncbi:lipopolysaccharide biosynthesis protein [Candidatus Thalassolituus haligoni]|uniref:lipopolysaccharide biosynthesis protein n=1 Tax=Candidatus Thalassolituus haligoni TaxID=3100113 RepID=UPI0035196963|tara:strand:- start:13416 stop:14654 length:1239 start_codon:yes stop_codon:yes gene_type:complete
MTYNSTEKQNQHERAKLIRECFVQPEFALFESSYLDVKETDVEAIKETTSYRVSGFLKKNMVIVAFLILYFLIALYYLIISSPRFVSETQFVVKESGSQSNINSLSLLTGFGTGTNDALLVKAYIGSRKLALELDSEIGLKTHYQSDDIDIFSKLSVDATTEKYYEYYKKHVLIYHDEVSGILKVEVQAFDPKYAKLVADKIINLSEVFINNIGDKMFKEQVEYAKEEVIRAHGLLSEWQTKLIVFQETNKLLSPQEEGGGIVTGINELQVSIIKEEAKLKEIQSVMHDNTTEVLAQKNLLLALKSQLEEEKKKVTDSDSNGLNRLTAEYQELSMAVEMTSDLYRSALVSLDSVRSQAVQKLKHLLIVENPGVTDEPRYPNKPHKLVTWLLVLILAFGLVSLAATVIREHKE